MLDAHTEHNLAHFKTVRSFCQSLFEHSNFVYFHYGFSFDGTTLYQVSSNPEWNAHFYLNHFKKPILRFAEGLNFWDSFSDQGFLTDAQDLFGLNNGFTYRIKQGEGFEYFDLAMAPNQRNAKDYIVNSLDQIKRYVHYFKSEQNALFQSLEPHPLLHTTLIKTEKFENLWEPKYHTLFFRGRIVKLSSQEMTCILGIARGLTFKEMGTSLSISPRTVESYLERARNKLGLAHRKDLIKAFHSELSYLL